MLQCSNVESPKIVMSKGTHLIITIKETSSKQNENSGLKQEKKKKIQLMSVTERGEKRIDI